MRPFGLHDSGADLFFGEQPPARQESPWLGMDESQARIIPIAQPYACGPLTPESTPPEPALSTSQALRAWQELLSQPSSDAKRHHLIQTPGQTSSGDSTPMVVTPKLAPERDKDGNIEYKLKLIGPSPERFERLVTQLSWRLKQGRGQAVYELGLADNGDVVGITPAEMDASLTTLERMAVEIGGTVLILKEVVIHASVRRPDLDESGQPRKGSHGLLLGDGSGSSPTPALTKRQKAKEKWAARQSVRDADRRQAIIRPATKADLEDGTDSDTTSSQGSPKSPGETAETSLYDIPHFHLELDDAPVNKATAYVPRRKSAVKATVPETPPNAKSAPTPAPGSKKARGKAERSAARKEQRRLDLLRGDGTNPLWSESLLSPTTPHSVDEEEDDAILRQVPIENLSISFAEREDIIDPDPFGHVRIPSPQHSLHGDDRLSTEAQETSGGQATIPPSAAPATLWGQLQFPLLTGLERICIEALVVRKAGNDDGWGGDEADGWCLGEDDGWDLGGGSEDEL